MRRRILAAWRFFDAVPLPPPLRFLVVGASGIGVNMGVLWLLVGRFELPSFVAAALAIETSICSNFVLNDAWTFGSGRRVRPWWARVSVFHGAAAAAAGVNLGLFLLLTTVGDVYYLAADFVAIGVASAINFGVSATWIWRSSPPRAPAVPAGVKWPGGAPSKHLVVVPTYNERANIRSLIARILSLGREYEVLVVDDSSPDGTGEIVDAIARQESRVHVMHRDGKMGIGTAYVAGFRRALDLGADLIYQMDGDFSHDPDDLRRLAAAATPNSVVIGSRYIVGGSTPGWPLKRILMSRVANRATRILAGIPVRDATGGFKCWSRHVLSTLPLDTVHSSGFAFQVEMNNLAWRLGFSLVEVPITFEDRKAGQSKASLRIGLEMAAVICRLFLNPNQPYSPTSRP